MMAPAVAPTKAAPKPTKSAVRDPKISRESTSRPTAWVPSQCSAEGLRKEITLLEREGFLPDKLLLVLGQAVQRIDDADAAFVREAAQKEAGEAEKRLVTSLDGARLEKDARKAGAKLLEAFWSAGLSDALRARCEELTR